MPENARRSDGGNATNSDTDNINSVIDKISNSKEEKTLNGAVLQRATGKPAGSMFLFIFNFEVANFTM